MLTKLDKTESENLLSSPLLPVCFYPENVVCIMSVAYIQMHSRLLLSRKQTLWTLIGLHDPTTEAVWSGSTLFATYSKTWEKPVLSGLKIDKTKVFKINVSLMKVKSIAFCNIFDLH